MDIRDLDTSEPSARRTWHAVQERAVRADRPHALLEAFEAFEVVATEPGRWTARTWLEAVEGGAVVGVASLELPLAENLDVAEAEISVPPEHRRRGIARALWEAVRERALAAGRSRVGAELTLDPGRSQAGRVFADSVGAVDKHREDHLVADLPVPVAPFPAGLDLVTWRGRCPDEHREAYLAMRNQMNGEVPTGDLDLDAPTLDDARLTASEERLARSYDVRVAAAQRSSDGAFGGYSLLFVPHGASYAWQDDTFVVPEHRGHRLGAALKSANYADLPDHVTLVHTWTAPTNTAMHRTNTAMGFRVVEHMFEVEVSLAG